MNSRERILFLLIGLLLGYLGIAWFVKTSFVEPLRTKDADLASIEGQIEMKRAEVQKAKDAEYDLNVWRSRALPADVNLAQTLYLDFLRGIATEAGIDRPTISSTRPNSRADHFVRLPFNLRANCSLSQATNLLVSFYSSPIFHQIRRLSIRPNLDRGRIKDFDVTLAIEAVSMRDAVAKNSLPRAPADAPQNVFSKAAFSVLADKNPFQPTRIVPKGVVARETPPVVQEDVRGDYRISGIAVVDGQGKVWLTNEKTSQGLVVEQGKTVEIGSLVYKLVRVEPAKRAWIETGGQLGTVDYGGTLAQWQAVAQ